MALQTTIPKYSIPGQAGQIASLNFFDIYQAIPALRNLSGSIVPFGRLVRLVAATSSVELPSATGQLILGASVINTTNNAYLDSSNTQGIPVGELADVLTKGDIWLSCEVATVKPGDPVYVRHTANGGLNVIGGVANAAGTGLDLVPDAMFMSVAYSGLAIVKLNK